MAYRLIAHHKTGFANPGRVSMTAVANTLRRKLSFDVSTPQEFEEKVLKSETPVVVDFHASWCGPCKTLGPLLSSVMATYDGKVDFAKVDVDDMQDLAMEYGVMSVPTVLAIKRGEIVDQFVGVKQTDELHKFVDSLL